MDPGPSGLSGLDLSLPQSDQPCLIVEDSQPDSVSLEDDPETSYRTLLTKRLSTLQPSASSPVLELISSPFGSRSSQSDGQSQPPIPDAEMNPSLDDSEVLDVFNKCPSKQTDSRDSQLLQNEGTSQLCFLELSQSQEFGAEPVHQNQTRTSPGETRASTGPQVSLVLLHSQNQDRVQDQGQVHQSDELLSSQEDLFDKTGEPLEPVQQALTATPSRSLGLLHLSGSVPGTLVRNSLSQSSMDFVAPTPDNMTPIIVPTSPTDHLPPHSDEPMDTSLPPADQSQHRGPAPKLPSASTPVSQNTPGFETEGPLNVPSQPDFSHDVFVATQSQHISDSSQNLKPSLTSAAASNLSESCAVSLNLSINTEPQDEDEEATQIDHMDHDGTQEKTASNSENSPITESSTNNKNKASSGLSSCQTEDSQSAASQTKTQIVGSQNSVQTSSQQRIQVEKQTSKQETNANSQECKMLNEKTGHTSSQESAKAKKRPTEAVDEEVIVESRTGKLNMENKKTMSEGEKTDKSENSGASVEVEVGKYLSLGLVLSQSKLLLPGNREEEGDKTSAAANGVPTETGGMKSLDSSGDITFHFTLPKEGELIGPSISATPPLIGQLKQSLRHSTPIELNSFSQKSDVSAASDIIAESGDDSAERPNEKLSLRMKLVTPVEEGSSERFSLQKPTLSDEYPSVSKTEAKTLTSSPSVFSRVQQVHRAEPEGNSPLRGPLLASSQRNSLPNGQSDASPQEVTSDPQSSSGNGEGRRKNPFQNAPGAANSPNKADPETPPPRRTDPAHRRHVRTIQEVRTTVTRIITDVFYEDGREVDRTVTQESDEPVVQYQVMDVSPSRTGSCSVTSGDLADISSSTCTTGTGSSCATGRPEFLLPPNRGTRPTRAPPVGSVQDSAFQVSDSARSSPEQDGSGSSFVGLRVVAKWSSNGYFYSGRIIDDCGSGSGLGSDLGSGLGSGPGLGENRFRLRFDDGYECELWARDILLCDPIPTETEVTALNQDQTYSTGVVKGHKVEGQELLYHVERGAQRQWFSRSSVILSLDQGNKLREQHSLGPYEPVSALPKASDISLDNLVEGKRKRRGAPSALNSPSRALASPRGLRKPGPSPGPSPGSKRRLEKDQRTPSAKRGRLGAAQQAVPLNTSDSCSDLAPGSCEHVSGSCDGSCGLAETHGPLPQNSALFMGFVFLLTASSERDRLCNRSLAQEDIVQTGPYNKPYTESQLQQGGGIVLREFNQQQCEAAYQSLLIADQHCLNRKYLLCVSSGVPCVSHLWVRDCCRDNSVLNHRNYLLPAGLGPERTVREWRPRSSPFKSLRVLLLLDQQLDFWSELVSLGGGTALRLSPQQHSEFPAGELDVAVSDTSLPQVLLKRCSERDLPVVSVEWLIQSVVCGEQLGFSSEPQFRLDSSSSSSSS